MGNFSRPRTLTVFSSYSLCLPAVSQLCMHGYAINIYGQLSKPLGIACPASSIRDMSISVQREEARVRKGYGLCTLSEHGAPGQESCTVTVEKPGGRARLTPFLTFLGPRPCSPLTHKVLALRTLPQYPLCPPQPLMQGLTSRFEFNRTKVPPMFSPRIDGGGRDQDLQSSSESAA